LLSTPTLSTRPTYSCDKMGIDFWWTALPHIANSSVCLIQSYLRRPKDIALWTALVKNPSVEHLTIELADETKNKTTKQRPTHILTKKFVAIRFLHQSRWLHT
jgi:hypothetical protein